MTQIQNHIKHLTSKGYTQGQIGELIGYSGSYVSGVHTGSAKPSRRFKKVFMSVFNLKDEKVKQDSTNNDSIELLRKENEMLKDSIENYKRIISAINMLSKL